MVRPLQRQRPLNARLYFRERVSIFTKVPEETSDKLIESESVVERFIVTRSHVNTAPLAKLHPASSCKFAIGGAHSVGMYVVTSSEFASARQTLCYLQVVADDPEDNLRHQLLANWNFTIFGNPDAHREFDRISKFNGL